MTEVEDLQRIVVQKKEEESHILDDIRQSKKNLDALNTELKHCRDLAHNLDARLSPIKVMNHHIHMRDNNIQLTLPRLTIDFPLVPGQNQRIEGRKEPAEHIESRR